MLHNPTAKIHHLITHQENRFGTQRCTFSKSRNENTSYDEIPGLTEG